MRRREFIALFGGASIAWPLGAYAQRGERMRRIGVLMGIANDSEGKSRIAAFQQALRELGWTEGDNVQLYYRWAAGDPDRIRTFAAELVALMPDVILVTSTDATETLAHETQSIPIVFAQSADVVSAGLTASLGRPGGNITGFSAVEYTLGGKWVEMLKRIAPGVVNMLFLNSLGDPTALGYVQAAERAARSTGVKLTTKRVRNGAEIEEAIDTFAREPNGGLIVEPSAVSTVHRERIVALASRHRLPAVYPYRFYCASGGLMSYGIDNIDLYRRAASYVDRILRGAKPADLPIQQPTKFELVINLKTAMGLSLEVPPQLQQLADEVIE
jgi:putative ABC transport system substrate-binding protein